MVCFILISSNMCERKIQPQKKKRHLVERYVFLQTKYLLRNYTHLIFKHVRIRLHILIESTKQNVTRY